MNNNAKKWVEALRSGEFKQTRGTLRDVYGHCCLGVACELYRRETGQGEWEGDEYDTPAFCATDTDKGTGILPRSVMTWLGLGSVYSEYGKSGEYGRERQLTADNDEGRTFTEIADIIESEPEGLFT